MATILTKKRDTTGAPGAGDLTNSASGAELAVNTFDKRLYTKDSGGNVVEVGTNPGAAVTFTAGSVSAPSITTTGDTNTGIFFPAADTIAFAEGGAEAMRIDSSGRVGIGTSSPSEKLQVQNGVFHITDGTLVLRQGVSAPNFGYIGMQSNHGLILFTNDTERMRIDSSGNVGIGTSSPSNNGLTLGTSASGKNLTIYSSADGSNGLIQFYDKNSFASFQIGGASDASYFYGAGARPMLFYTNDTERARITSGGYFKASNSGNYFDSTGTFHEFNQNAADANTRFYSTNASLNDIIVFARAVRSANSAYRFFEGTSSDGSDVEFNLSGDGNGYADGTWNNNGADYAEYFESATGAALTLGATVVLDGNKVREATPSDPTSAIIGVVRPKEPSKASMVVGNTAWNKWANKYLTDDFDRYIMEDHDVVEWTDEDGKQHSYESHNIPEGVIVPTDAVRKTHDDKGNKFQHYKLNPAWDKDAEYTPREQRPEWNIIGLVGQVKILKGQPVNDRWVKMRDVSATVEEWFIR